MRREDPLTLPHGKRGGESEEGVGRKKGQKEKVLEEEEEEDREEQLRIVPRLFALQPSTGGGEPTHRRALAFVSSSSFLSGRDKQPRRRQFWISLSASCRPG